VIVSSGKFSGLAIFSRFKFAGIVIFSSGKFIGPIFGLDDSQRQFL
jgi:hypothetical protein